MGVKRAIIEFQKKPTDNMSGVLVRTKTGLLGRTIKGENDYDYEHRNKVTVHIVDEETYLPVWCDLTRSEMKIFTSPDNLEISTYIKSYKIIEE
jgi:hypothetical protein